MVLSVRPMNLANCVMRNCRQILIVLATLPLAGCVREHADGNTIVVTYPWWSVLGGILLPMILLSFIVSKHPRTWVNGKWIPWWRMYRWNIPEFGFVGGLLAAMVLASMIFLDRLEVTPDYMRESSLSPLRGTRQIAFRDVQRIELPPPNDDGFLGIKQPRKKTPPAMRVFLKDGREEVFNGRQIRHALTKIIANAHNAGVIVTNEPANSNPPPVRADDGEQVIPDFNPFGNAKARLDRAAPNRNQRRP
jgi:hypothetical protein